MSDHTQKHDPQWVARATTFTECQLLEYPGEDHVGVGGFVCKDCDARNVMFSMRAGPYIIESAVTVEDARTLAMAVLAACDRVDGKTVTN
jgi:hypothetical protein